MPKKTSESPIGAATHRLTLEIERPHATVWKSFTGEIQSWWPRDFYATRVPQRMVFEIKPGGRLYEDAGDGNGLVWYQIIALDAPHSISLAGFVAAVRRTGHFASSRSIFRSRQSEHCHGSHRFGLRVPGRFERHS